MKVITIMELKEGMELAEEVEAAGTVIFPKNTKVNDKVIDRIKRYGIMCVTIMEPVDYATTHYERIHYNKEFQEFCKTYNDCLNRYKGIFISYLQTKQSIDPNDLLSIYKECEDKIASEYQLLDFLYNMMPNEDELTYTQSFNAALLCGSFSNWLGLDSADKNNLILCGFYYDIGKWMIPPEILWKPGKLTEEEFALVKKHPVTGYALLRGDAKLDDHIKNAVIMHHERYDGSGYPYHMVGEKIDRYARYMAIIDTYIAMASPRSFRNAFTPLEILGNLQSSIEKYDASILLPLMDRIADTQLGVEIQLSDDTVWEIILINKHNYAKPILKSDNDDILDLTTRNDLKISKIV